MNTPQLSEETEKLLEELLAIDTYPPLCEYRQGTYCKPEEYARLTREWWEHQHKVSALEIKYLEAAQKDDPHFYRDRGDWTTKYNRHSYLSEVDIVRINDNA